jgi:RHS repeat-associated protein
MEVVMRMWLAMREYVAVVTLGIGLAVLPWSCPAEAGPPQAFATPVAPTQTTLSDGRTLVLGANGTYLESADAIRKRTPLAAPPFVGRSHHTATVLPNGRVLIWGGLDSGDHIAPGAWFDAVDDTFSSAADVALLPRAGHTATVLTDGRLLVTGGWSERLGSLTEAELWDYRTNRSELLKGELIPPRIGHSATLLADGRVLIVGGYDEQGRRYTDAALYESSRVRFIEVDPATGDNMLATSSGQTPSVAATIPLPDVTDFAPNGLIALRFSTLMDARSLKSTVTLVGQEGIVAVDAVAAEGGRLLFVHPLADLYPGSRYTLFVDGAQSLGGKKLAFTAMGFSTAVLTGSSGTGSSDVGPDSSSGSGAFDEPPNADSAAGEPPAGQAPDTRGKNLGPGTGGEMWLSTGSNANDVRPGCSPTAPPDAFCRAASRKQDGLWLPGLDTLDGHWRINGAYPPLPDRSLLNRRPVAPGSTALYGQVMRIDDTPVANVEVSIGNVSTRTDGEGVFVLTRIPGGRQQLVVDGTTANGPDAEYGDFVMGVKVEAGVATPMPNVLYLPRIRAQDKVTISSPLARDTVITHPELPGVEIHIPAGTVLKDRKGHAVTDLAVVPMPVDRAPFPPPINFPIFFVLEPGGLVIQGLSVEASKGVQILYPNMTHDAPGTHADLLVYDPMAGWDWYGSGHVTDDGKHVAPDQGVGLHTVMSPGYGIGNNTPPPDVPPPTCNTCPCGIGTGPGGGGPGGGGPTWGGGSSPGCGDPVDLSSGLFVHRVTDLAVADVLPLDVTRTYRQGDVPNKRAFGVGTSFNYGMYLYNATGDSQDYYTFQVILPDGGRVTYNLVSGTLNQAGATFLPSGAAGPFEGSRIEFKNDVLADNNQLAFVLTLRNGFQYVFYGHAIYNNVMLGVRDRFGNTIRVTNNAGMIRRITSPSGRYIDFTPDPRNRISVATDNTGRSVNYYYTSTTDTGLLQYVQYPDSTTEQYTYDSAGNGQMLTVVDRRGNTMVTNTYYSDGKVNTQTLADGGTYTLSYTTNGSGVITAAHEIDPRSHVRDITFDANGYALTDSRAVGASIQQTTTYTRDALSRVISAIDASGRKTTYTYDAFGNRLTVKYLTGSQVIGPHDIQYTYTYTTTYNLLHTVTDPLQHTTTYDYSNGCLNKLTDALGNYSQYSCNGAGQVITKTDMLSHVTTYEYDGYDLRKITDPLGRAMVYNKDALGRLIASQDAIGNTAAYEYDSNDRITKFVDAMAAQTLFGYDNNGNLTSVTDPNNGITQYGYDARNRRTSRTDALGHQESWFYDVNSNLKQLTSRENQKTTYLYDELDRRTLVTFNDQNSVGYTWNTRNQNTQIVDSVSGTIVRTFDGLNRLTQEQSPQGTIAYTYDSASRRLSMTPSGQLQVNYTFDNANRLRTITQGSEVVGIDFDDADRRTKLTLPNGVYTTYDYDSANELTTLTYKNTNNVVLGTLTYSYDGDGRRISQGGSWAPEQLPQPTSTDSAFNLANEQTSLNGTIITYDLNGSMTQDARGTYWWDARNRLTSILGGAITWGAYTYDAVGRRTSAIENLSPLRTYLYDGWNLVQETQGTTTLPILSGLSVDEVFARTESNGRRYLLSDAMGSTVALTDSGGSIAQTYSYAPYGTVTATGGSDNTIQYTGRENDGTDGLYYYRARYYSPSLNRFISEDPIELRGGLNTYAYVHGDPMDLRDPSGYQAQGALVVCAVAPEVCLVGVVVIGAGVYLYCRTHNNPPPPAEPDCREIAAMCRAGCSETALPSGDHGFRFWNCVNRCMEQNGCA